MHCKFLVCLLIVFYFFLFFLSACEFRFIERIGAHGKQNPDFIYHYFNIISLSLLLLLSSPSLPLLLTLMTKFDEFHQ